MKNNSLSTVAILRQKAEELLIKKLPVQPGVRKFNQLVNLSDDETLKLIYELEVHQIELEMQNEELTNALSAAKDAIDLYDFAPCGYFTLSKEGRIIRLNLNGSQMLGKNRITRKNG